MEAVLQCTFVLLMIAIYSVLFELKAYIKAKREVIEQKYEQDV